jgi:hypothetical protein
MKYFLITLTCLALSLDVFSESSVLRAIIFIHKTFGKKRIKNTLQIMQSKYYDANYVFNNLSYPEREILEQLVNLCC